MKLHYCLTSKGWLVRYPDQNLYERDVFTPEEVGQILGGN